jgi:iron complex outermembrane receptor protein
LALACLYGLACSTAASEDLPKDPAIDLDAVRVTGQQANGFLPRGAASTAKGGTPPERLPFSVSVVTRALLDSQQTRSLADALGNAAGVTPGAFGRRGWDDLIIRGQVSSDSLFVDGLRTASANRVAEQMFGVQDVEVFKGPASLLFGQVLPGGLVNMVSRRPQDQTFLSGELRTGSYGLRQAGVDANTPLGERAALRVNAMAMNSDDPTDHVTFRERWVAPALSLQLGEATDLTVLTSHQQRRYMRQQGLPQEGSLLANPNGRIRRSLYTGEPSQRPYDGDQTRIGTLLDHRFDNGWTLHNGLRWQDFDLTGDFVSNNGMAANLRTLRRSAVHQVWGGDTLVQDTYLSGKVGTDAISHTVTVGLDAFRTREVSKQATCRVGTLDVFAPVYTGITCPASFSRDNLSEVRAGGLYLRDQIEIARRWQLLLGLRHDRSEVITENHLAGTSETSRDSANTGSAALMFEAANGVRPYVSYATSFYPNTGTDIAGQGFDPEQGRQLEAGVKIDLAGGLANLTAAVYDLRRQNVLQSDPVNDGYSIAVGEQRSRGGELNLTADLGSGLSVNAGYAYTDAEITDDGGQPATTVGQPLNNVPLHSGNLWLHYAPARDGDGWNVSGGLRAAGSRYSYGYTLPGYVTADIGVGYRLGRWDAALNLRNLLDKEYFAGGLQRAVALGDPRTLLFKIGFRY